MLWVGIEFPEVGRGHRQPYLGAELKRVSWKARRRGSPWIRRSTRRGFRAGLTSLSGCLIEPGAKCRSAQSEVLGLGVVWGRRELFFGHKALACDKQFV